MKKISAIIPTYNAERYIEKCVDSISNQTYKNIEIIIVNDGSTDNTLSVCKKLKKEYQNIVILDKINGGPNSAREYGLKNATGYYISFIDSDDYIDEEFYQKLVEAIEKDEADIAECGYKLVDEKYKIISSTIFCKNVIKSNYECVESYIKKINTTNFLCNKLFKKNLFNNVEFVKLFASEDSCTLLQLFSNSNKKVTIQECLYNYVQTNESLCRKEYNLRKNDIVIAGEYMHNFCIKKYPELSLYYSAFICSSAARCYADIMYSNIENKKTYMDIMQKKFNEYYKKCKIRDLNISILRKYLILIFKFSPKISSYIYKKVLKK